MKSSFKDLSFPPSREYSSSSSYLPLDFFDEVFPISKTVDIWLGYFTTNSFRILSLPLAEFIHNGGKLRIVACHYLNDEDFHFLFEDKEQNLINIYNTVEKIKESLDSHGQHFFDCLRFLLKTEKLEIKIVKFNDRLSHDKKMLFFDGENYISTIGSLNFTVPGIIWNGESFQINVDWETNHERTRIRDFQYEFERILNDNHEYYQPIGADMIELINEVGHDLLLKDLLISSFNLENKTLSNKYSQILFKRRLRLSKLKLDETVPSFPYDEPRAYQIKAYKNWLDNNKKGLFSMATGTGKTLTALNIVLNEYFKSNFYRCIILVPTDALVSQWNEECKSFNFYNIFSSNEKSWRNTLKEKNFFIKTKPELSYIFISTYASFLHKNSLPIINSLVDDELILIVDEAHGIGTEHSYNRLPKQFKKRIGLSATPDRRNDNFGNNALNDFFDTKPPKYTFDYTLLQAIKNNFLTPYEYYPRLINLTSEEIRSYAEISKKLLKHYDFKNNKFRDSAKRLLIQRKHIINKAENKKEMLKQIISELKLREEVVSHIVVFVPEGYDEGDKSDSAHLINLYTKIISKELNIKARQFGKSERNTIIEQFKAGKIQVLTAMKMLDEGVDIPEIKTAIFCSSTGNPRQYVQRRGRILRKTKDKTINKEYAEVFDMIVSPNPRVFWDFLPFDKSEQIIKMEKNVFRNEMFRVINFLYACDNISDLIQEKGDFKKLVYLCDELEIDIFKEIQMLQNQDENQESKNTREL